MKLQAIGDRLSASWDGHELPGGPVVDGRIASGYAGVYANFVGVPRVGETFVDGFTVKD